MTVLLAVFGFGGVSLADNEIDISSATISSVNSKYAYTQSEILPEPTVKIKVEGTNITLQSGTDYEVTYVDNIDVGTAKITITGIGKYTGSKEKTFVITNNIADMTVNGPTLTTFVVTGQPIEPEIAKVYLGLTTLQLGTDYEVTYVDNTDVGTAKITITGIGKYTGSKEKTFTIIDESDITYTLDGAPKTTNFSSSIGSNGEYKLYKDASLTLRLVPGIFASNVTLDLNGHNLNSTASDYGILLNRAGSESSPNIFNIVDTSEQKNGSFNMTASIFVNGNYNTLNIDGKLNNTNSNDFVIATNGLTSKNPIINVKSNAIISAEGPAVYLPGNVNLNSTIDGKVIGRTAVEIRAGNLTINDGAELKANGEFSKAPNGNGTTMNGVALAISQHTTNLPINVTINGGNFEGEYALYEEDLQDEVATDNIQIIILSGLFDGKVYSENVTKFIKGGIFTEKPDINYIADGYSIYKNDYGKYVVATTAKAEQGAAEAIVAPDPVVAAETTFTTGAAENFSVAIPAEDSSKTSVVEQKLPDVAGDSATYTLVVDTQETIQKVDESGDTTTTMTGVKESELRSSADKTPEIKGGAEVYIQKADGTNTGKSVSSVTFSKPVAIPIFVGKSLAGQSVFVKVKHAVGGSFGIDGLVTDGTDCAAVATSTPSVTVGANGFVIVYTCKASTFVAYTETGTTSSSTPTSPSSTSGGGGGTPSYSCKSLPANAVANNTSKPKKNTNYSYSTDTGAVCTFQCKSGYTWNEKDEKCEKSEETVADTDKQDTEKVESDATDTDNETSDTSSEDLKKVLDDGYTVEFHNAYDFAFKNGITTMPSIEEAHMNSPLTRIAMAKMLSQYAINVLGKKPANVVVPNFPDVSPELDAEYNNGVTLAYQLGIMGINIENFRPDDLVTRAEFATALSRLLYNTPDGEGAYYETHLKKLMEEKVITVADPDMHELRGYVMIMLMRSAKNN